MVVVLFFYNTPQTTMHWFLVFLMLLIPSISPLPSHDRALQNKKQLQLLPQTHYLSLIPPQTRVMQSVNKFSNKLYNVMNEYTQEDSLEQQPNPSSTDLLYSPLLVYTSLCTLRSASTSVSFQELTNTLSLSKVNSTVLQQGMHWILSKLALPDHNGSVNMVNRLFLDLAFHPNERFVNSIHDKFYSELVQTSFADATAASMFVNDHMYKSSHGVLQDVLAVEGEEDGAGSSTINPLQQQQHLIIDGGLMLVSGFTLEADFDRPFTPLLTRKERFYREDGSSVMVDMMHRDGVYFWAEIAELNATALSIPYTGYRYSLTILLPEEGVSVSELETNIESFPFIAVLSRLNKKYVQVSLPKFQVDMSVDLIDPLEKLGISGVFSEDGGDLGGIVEGGNNELYLTNAVSKAVLDVSEGGSRVKSANFVEAVPATARHLTPLTVNRPFVFFISDQMLQTVLLVGRKVF